MKSKDISPENIKLVIADHFPDRTYQNFAPLFRRKIREYNLNKSVQGTIREKGNLCDNTGMF